MLSRFQVAALALTFTTGLVAAGCGANTSLSPTGPSAGPLAFGAVTSDLIVSADANDAATAMDKGGHRGPGSAGSDDDEREGRGNRGVEVNGRITAIDTAARTLTIGTRQVSVPATATIRHGWRTLTLADLEIGDHVEIKGSITGTTFVASEVKVEQGGDDEDDEAEDDDDDDANEVKLAGAVSARAGTCPALTFTVQSKKVTTTAATTFREILCTAIADGSVVEVKGTLQTDGSVLARRVSLED